MGRWGGRDRPALQLNTLDFAAIGFDSGFEESKHPRNPDGEFTSGGGSAAATKREPNSKKEVKTASAELSEFHDFMDNYEVTPEGNFADPDLERLNSLMYEWEPEDFDPYFPIDRGPVKAIRELIDQWDPLDADFDPEDPDFLAELRALSNQIKPPKDVKVENTDLYRSLEEFIGADYLDELPKDLRKEAKPLLTKADKLYDKLAAEPWLTESGLEDLQQTLSELLPKAEEHFGRDLEWHQENDPDFEEDDYLASEQFVDHLRALDWVLDDMREKVAVQEKLLDEMGVLPSSAAVAEKHEALRRELGGE